MQVGPIDNEMPQSPVELIRTTPRRLATTEGFSLTIYEVASQLDDKKLAQLVALGAINEIYRGRCDELWTLRLVSAKSCL